MAVAEAAAVAAAAAGRGRGGGAVRAPVAAGSRRRLQQLGPVLQRLGQRQLLGPALQPPALGPRRVLVPPGVRLALGRQPVMSRGAPVPRQVR